jgi:2-C-methyl-D-erythritol 4-phosphate cytidylyltransferase
VRVTALVPAAGAGSRFGGEVSKQFVRLGDRPVLAHSLSMLDSVFDVDEIILVVPAGQEERCRVECIEPFGIKKVFRIVSGAPERQGSVYCGLVEVSRETDIVLVHDGVRPFVTAAIIQQVIKAAARSGAAIAAVPVRDTLKTVSAEGTVSETLDRRSVFLAQTPQAFLRTLLMEAFEQAFRDGMMMTDDSALVERLGHPVSVVAGSWDNIKITHWDDLQLGERILSSRSGDLSS